MKIFKNVYDTETGFERFQSPSKEYLWSCRWVGKMEEKVLDLCNYNPVSKLSLQHFSNVDEVIHVTEKIITSVSMDMTRID